MPGTRFSVINVLLFPSANSGHHIQSIPFSQRLLDHHTIIPSYQGSTFAAYQLKFSILPIQAQHLLDHHIITSSLYIRCPPTQLFYLTNKSTASLPHHQKTTPTTPLPPLFHITTLKTTCHLQSAPSSTKSPPSSPTFATGSIGTEGRHTTTSLLPDPYSTTLKADISLEMRPMEPTLRHKETWKPPVHPSSTAQPPPAPAAAMREPDAGPGPIRMISVWRE